MDIQGIGTDIIEIQRIRDSFERRGDLFLQKLFTEKEIAYCQKYQDPFPHYAGRFAAKEAIVKALGTGFGKEAEWLSIEILNDKNGKPVATIEKSENLLVLLSISHCKEYAVAYAITLYRG